MSPIKFILSPKWRKSVLRAFHGALAPSANKPSNRVYRALHPSDQWLAVCWLQQRHTYNHELWSHKQARESLAAIRNDKKTILLCRTQTVLGPKGLQNPPVSTFSFYAANIWNETQDGCSSAENLHLFTSNLKPEICHGRWWCFDSDPLLLFRWWMNFLLLCSFWAFVLQMWSSLRPAGESQVSDLSATGTLCAHLIWRLNEFVCDRSIGRRWVWQEMEKTSRPQVLLHSSSDGALGNSTLMLSNHFSFTMINTLKPIYRLPSCWKMKVKTTFVCDKAILYSHDSSTVENY